MALMKTAVIMSISSLVLLLSACGTTNKFAQKKFLTLDKLVTTPEVKPSEYVPEIIENSENKFNNKKQELSKPLIFENQTTPKNLSQLEDSNDQEDAFETTQSPNTTVAEKASRNNNAHLLRISTESVNSEKAIAQGSEKKKADQSQAALTAQLPWYYKVLIALAIIILLPLFVIGLVYAFLIFL